MFGAFFWYLNTSVQHDMNTERTMEIRLTTLVLALTVIAMNGGCADDEAAQGWRVQDGGGDRTSFGEQSDVIVVSSGETFVVTRDGAPDECVQAGDVCVDVTEAEGQYCADEGAQADVVVDEQGEVVTVICYPPRDGSTQVEELEPDEDGNLEVEQSESGAVLTFTPESDGVVIQGDLTLESERTTLFGNGSDRTLLGGDLVVASNNSRVRGVTVEGDVSYTTNANSSALMFSKIHGDLTVNANGFSAASVQVFGNVNVTGNGATLVGIGVQGEWNVNPGSECEGCYSFEDENSDFVVLQQERDGELSCDPGMRP